MKKLLLFLIITLAFISYSLAKTNYLQVRIDWMYDNGLTKYNTMKDFMPDNIVTREQASKFFSLFAQIKFSKAEDGNKSCYFNDINKADPTLVSSIISACKMGILKGHNGQFRPKDKLTKAEALTMLMRIIVGDLIEPTGSFYANYLAKAKELGIFVETSNVNLGATRSEMSLWLYRAHLHTEKEKINPLCEGSLDFTCSNTSIGVVAMIRVSEIDNQFGNHSAFFPGPQGIIENILEGPCDTDTLKFSTRPVYADPSTWGPPGTGPAPIVTPAFDIPLDWDGSWYATGITIRSTGQPVTTANICNILLGL